MPQMIDTTTKLYAPEEAERVAELLTANDLDGWKFRAVHAPTGAGFSVVEVFDADGHRVGRMFGLY